MSADVPEHEPISLQAGNTAQWTKSLSDFPASDGWALTYAIRSTAPTAALIDITAAADGDDFSVSVPAATTAEWQPGTYWMVGYVTLSPDRFEVYRGTLEITPNVASIGEGQAFDGRSYWRRILDQLKAEIENGAIRSVIRYSYNGVSTEVVTMEDAFKALAYVENKVAQEESPSGHNRKILTRFRAP